ncbi:phosphoribosylamine--glycine ligase [Kocuria coralli]|uniref:Phosphoribosylamine--glycine ligase n=1 Tax=Kocuria coralli TaxID=1461025 RepID=A0A5J5L056_9MICC|nr:phosphoribosylamine--glycine ligase [Kocuria coralli]KAA9395324.1 phosphoribosylamine--glycine ligase [Kocuria coralli]
MRTLVIGTGGREHAIVRALLRDPAVEEVHAAPGNAGIARDVPVHAVEAADGAAVVQLAQDLGADLVVVGPELPLVSGVADALHGAGIAVFGPTAQAAVLEGSKSFAKDVMTAAGVPTAASRTCVTENQVAAALDEFGAPHVVKDDGLAAGKGVVVTDDRDAALEHARACFAADGHVVVEEFLDGPEVSLFVLCDGRDVVPLAPAQDFKRIGDGDQGPNTGGMGAYTPLDWLPEDFTDEVVETVARPVVEEMARRGTPFSGVLYCGLAVTARGVKVIEFNVRFGDPETQSVLARLDSPLGELLLDAAQGRLGEGRHLPLRWNPSASVNVVVASEGYPESSRRGDPITGLAEAEALEGVSVLHAGTAEGSGETAGEIVAAGGRVLSVVALGKDLQQARERAYEGIGRIGLEGSQHRTDIALKAATGQISVS